MVLGLGLHTVNWKRRLLGSVVPDPVPSRAFASSMKELEDVALLDSRAAARTSRVPAQPEEFQMYIGFGTLVVVLVIVLIIYFIRRA